MDTLWSCVITIIILCFIGVLVWLLWKRASPSKKFKGGGIKMTGGDGIDVFINECVQRAIALMRTDITPADYGNISLELERLFRGNYALLASCLQRVYFAAIGTPLLVHAEAPGLYGDFNANKPVSYLLISYTLRYMADFEYLEQYYTELPNIIEIFKQCYDERENLESIAGEIYRSSPYECSYIMFVYVALSAPTPENDIYGWLMGVINASLTQPMSSADMLSISAFVDVLNDSQSYTNYGITDIYHQISINLWHNVLWNNGFIRHVLVGMVFPACTTSIENLYLYGQIGYDLINAIDSARRVVYNNDVSYIEGYAVVMKAYMSVLVGVFNGNNSIINDQHYMLMLMHALELVTYIHNPDAEGEIYNMFYTMIAAVSMHITSLPNVDINILLSMLRIILQRLHTLRTYEPPIIVPGINVPDVQLLYMTLTEYN